MNHKEHEGLHRKDRKGRKEQPPPFGLSEKIFQNIKHLEHSLVTCGTRFMFWNIVSERSASGAAAAAHV